MPPSNSIISPYMTSARPWMRITPSDTPTMVPSLRAWALTSRLSMRCLMTSLISDGFSCCICSFLNSFPGLGIQCLGQFLQLPAHGAVDDHVPRPYDQSADQAVVDLDFDLHLPLQPLA